MSGQYAETGFDHCVQSGVRWVPLNLWLHSTDRNFASVSKYIGVVWSGALFHGAALFFAVGGLGGRPES